MKIDICVGFVGLSHLGICSLAAAASKNFKVVGIADNSELINKYKKKNFILMKKNYIN